MAEPSGIRETPSETSIPGVITQSFGTGDDPPMARIEKLRPRAAFRTLAMLFKIAGPLLAPLISDGAVTIDGNRYSLTAVMVSEKARMKVIAEIVTHLDELNPDAILELADRLLVNQCAIKLPGTEGYTPIVAPEGASPEARGALLDALVPDVWMLIGMVRVALKLNYSPTSAVASISGSMSAAKTQPKPAVT